MGWPVEVASLLSHCKIVASAPCVRLYTLKPIGSAMKQIASVSRVVLCLGLYLLSISKKKWYKQIHVKSDYIYW